MFGSIIKKEREKLGLTQKVMSDSIGININTLASYEKGTREPNFDTLIKFANYFGCTTDYLLGMSEFENDAAMFKSIEKLGAIAKAIGDVDALDAVVFSDAIRQILEGFSQLSGYPALQELYKQSVNTFSHELHSTAHDTGMICNAHDLALKRGSKSRGALGVVVFMFISNLNDRKSITSSALEGYFKQTETHVKSLLPEKMRDQTPQRILDIAERAYKFQNDPEADGFVEYFDDEGDDYAETKE